ncbi:hypothetical protein [Streptomyces genisteinicus]|uniref:Secreted protein n=1 Tax=Streptomyces genisteinicus TaxID=2768068 RepID=A0A7H0I2I5_9ACTN|nr:hypothetical protein [Streptomyces genisteinicus]QNP67001.1 hypothetical protein IAG43_31580 [Streptomyces genisteinicus]
MKKRSILAVMSFATGAVIAAVSPPPAAQAGTLDEALNTGDALSRIDTLPTDLAGDTTAVAGDALPGQG